MTENVPGEHESDFTGIVTRRRTALARRARNASDASAGIINNSIHINSIYNDFRKVTLYSSVRISVKSLFIGSLSLSFIRSLSLW